MAALLLSQMLSTKDGGTWGCNSALAESMSGTSADPDRLQVERTGGYAGFGGPHLKSRGEVALSHLSPADRQAIEALFTNPHTVQSGQPGAADSFRYHLTRHTASGSETIEVPEDAVPRSVRDSVKDVLE
jgi:hypothetical protein